MPHFVITTSTVVEAASAGDAVGTLTGSLEAGAFTVLEATADGPAGVLAAAELRNCDACGRVTDAGGFPDWVNGVCETCDPAIWQHPLNQERMST